jgi:hypothetical protein
VTRTDRKRTVGLVAGTAAVAQRSTAAAYSNASDGGWPTPALPDALTSLPAYADRSASSSGRRGRRFKSRHPDHIFAGHGVSSRPLWTAVGVTGRILGGSAGSGAEEAAQSAVPSSWTSEAIADQLQVPSAMARVLAGNLEQLGVVMTGDQWKITALGPENLGGADSGPRQGAKDTDPT